MKKLISLFKVECKRIFTSRTLYLSALVFAVLYLLSCQNIEGSTVIEQMEKVLWAGSFRHLCTVCMVLPYGLSYYQEKKSNNLQMLISRSGKENYCISKVFSCFLSGGIVAVMGVFLFVVVLHCFVGLPLAETNMSKAVSDYYNNIMINNQQYMQYWIAQGIEHFLYGGTTAVLGLLFSMFIANPFVAAIGPYMFLYVVKIVTESRIPIELQIECVATGSIQIASFSLGIVYIVGFFFVYLCLEYFMVCELFQRKQ